MTRRDFAKTATVLAAAAASLKASAELRYSLEFLRGGRNIPGSPCGAQSWLLEAIVAPHVPELLVVRADADGPLRFAETDQASHHAVYELRSYAVAGGTPPSLEAFRRNGIRPVLFGTSGTMPLADSSARRIYLIGFDSFESRARAWDEFAADAGAAPGLGYAVSFYRRVA